MSHSAERERLLTGYSGRIFLTVSLGWLFIQMGRQLLPPLLPIIIEDLSITSTQAGVALSVLWAVYAVCQYPSGRLSDQFSRKTLLVAGLGCLVVGFLLIWGTLTYPMFLVGVSVVGLGAGLYPTAARAFISDLYVARRGQAFGIHTASGDLGNAAAAGLAVVAVGVATWQTSFLPVVLLLGGVLVAVHVWSDEPYLFGSVDLEVRATGRRLFSSGRVRWLLVAYALFAFTWQSTTSFLPTLLQSAKGFSVGLASGGFATLFLVGTAVKPLAGTLGDRFGRPVVAVGALSLGLLGLGSLLVAEATLAIFVSVGVFAAGLMAFPPAMQAFLMDLFPDESMGGDLGAMRTFYIGFGSLGSTYVGYVAALESYTLAFVGLVVCLLVSAGIVAAVELTAE